MKKNITKLLALVLCAGVLVSSVSTVAYALNAEQKEEKDISALVEEEGEQLTKEEIVYVLTGADGGVQKIIVSDWIKNNAGSASISDKSELFDVENVKGDETYTMDGDNMRVWDAQGNDIYYQGNTEKELPVALSVSYTLDGKAISPSELAGKSGRVTIRFEYDNKQYEMVEIQGKQEKMYVPFTMMTGMMLDNDIFTNVEVNNGRLLNDGSRTIVAGIAFPGLQSNLNLDAEKLEIPDYVEISADVNGFEMTNTVTLASNEIFSNVNTEEMDSMNDLTNAMDELTGAMGQLVDGSSELYDGLCTLLEKSEELITGINQLADGAEKLKNGAGEVDAGTGELAAGSRDLANGLGTLTANNDTLNAGSQKVFESLLSMANQQLTAAGISAPTLTISNYSEVLNGIISSLDPDGIAAQAKEIAYRTVVQKVNEQRDTIRAAVQEEVTAQVTQAVRDNVDMQMQSEDIQSMIETKTEEQMAILIEQNMNSAEVQAQITAALEQAASGAAALSGLKEQLDSYNEFYLGLSQYTAGVASARTGADQLSQGADRLKSGTSEVYTGMTELYDGILTLKNGAPALVDGVTKLRDGALQLSDGMQEFNESGVQKLVDAVDGDLDGLITRVKAMVDVSRNYKSFSGLSDAMGGQVDFIYRTDAIEGE